MKNITIITTILLFLVVSANAQFLDLSNALFQVGSRQPSVNQVSYYKNVADKLMVIENGLTAVQEQLTLLPKIPDLVVYKQYSTIVRLKHQGLPDAIGASDTQYAKESVQQLQDAYQFFAGQAFKNPLVMTMLAANTKVLSQYYDLAETPVSVKQKRLQMQLEYLKGAESILMEEIKAKRTQIAPLFRTLPTIDPCPLTFSRANSDWDGEYKERNELYKVFLENDLLLQNEKRIILSVGHAGCTKDVIRVIAERYHNSHSKELKEIQDAMYSLSSAVMNIRNTRAYIDSILKNEQ